MLTASYQGQLFQNILKEEHMNFRASKERISTQEDFTYLKGLAHKWTPNYMSPNTNTFKFCYDLHQYGSRRLITTFTH